MTIDKCVFPALLKLMINIEIPQRHMCVHPSQSESVHTWSQIGKLSCYRAKWVTFQISITSCTPIQKHAHRPSLQNMSNFNRIGNRIFINFCKTCYFLLGLVSCSVVCQEPQHFALLPTRRVV